MLVAVVFSLAGISFLSAYALPEDAFLGNQPVTRAEAEGIIGQALALITPTPVDGAVITTSGNILISRPPSIVVVKRFNVRSVLPARCQSDYDHAAVGTTVVCFSDDFLFQNSIGGVAP